MPDLQTPHHVAVPQNQSASASRGATRAWYIAIVCAVAISSFVAGTRSDQLWAAIAPVFGIKASSDTLDLLSVQRTFQKLKANYDGTLDTNALIDGANRGMVAAAGDRYTVFMDKSEADAFNKELSGEVSGIGAEIGVRSGQPTILRTLANSPAEKAGVQAGDVILGVNDLSMRGASAADVAEKVRGEADTTVKLTLKRGNDTKEFTITRAKVSDPSVRTSVKDGVGIMKISRFDDQTGTLASEAARSFKDQNVKAIILDLRDDGGGYLDAARQVASLWLDKKVIVTERTGDTVTGTLKADGSPLLGGIKTVVLVNGGSASASEIVAGALQDHKAATLIGEKTFGKGTVQKVIELPGGRILKVTVARWYTPNGKNITKEGITPDMSVVLTSTDMDAGRDQQMDAALAAVK